VFCFSYLCRSTQHDAHGCSPARIVRPAVSEKLAGNVDLTRTLNPTALCSCQSRATSEHSFHSVTAMLDEQSWLLFISSPIMMVELCLFVYSVRLYSCHFLLIPSHCNACHLNAFPLPFVWPGSCIDFGFAHAYFMCEGSQLNGCNGGH
jgi:hypothetical protein